MSEVWACFSPEPTPWVPCDALLFIRHSTRFTQGRGWFPLPIVTVWAFTTFLDCTTCGDEVLFLTRMLSLLSVVALAQATAPRLTSFVGELTMQESLWAGWTQGFLVEITTTCLHRS